MRMKYVRLIGRWVRNVLCRRTIEDVYARGEDNFLLLRFAAASLVIWGHSYALCGQPGDGDFIASSHLGEGLYTGSVAVDMFFVISGFLVTASFTNRNNGWQFLKSRALRLLPAYFACLVLSVLILGPLFSELPLREYFGSSDTWNYLLINVEFGRQLAWNLPGVFSYNFTPNVVNGSIWTLPSEARMYALVAVLGVATILRRRLIANLVLAALLGAGAVSINGVRVFDHAAFAHLAGMFIIGMLLWTNRSFVPLSGVVLLTLALLTAAICRTQLFPFALATLIAYFCLWFAYVPNLHFFNRCGDYSYGLYLWGYPVQQSVAALVGHPTSPFFNFLASFLATLPLAVVSWHFLEKPALRLKNRVIFTGSACVW